MHPAPAPVPAPSPAPPVVEKLRDAGRTRAAILKASQTLFAEKGYSATGVREIASEAGINAALVRRYFGSKEGLFRAALEDVLVIEPLIHGDRASFGARVMALLFRAETIPSPLAMMLFAASDPDARRLCSDLLEARILHPLARWLEGEDAWDRAVRMQMLWIGFIAWRQILQLPSLDAARVASVRDWLAQLTQQIADGG